MKVIRAWRLPETMRRTIEEASHDASGGGGVICRKASAPVRTELSAARYDQRPRQAPRSARLPEAARGGAAPPQAHSRPHLHFPGDCRARPLRRALPAEIGARVSGAREPEHDRE